MFATCLDASWRKAATECSNYHPLLKTMQCVGKRGKQLPDAQRVGEARTAVRVRMQDAIKVDKEDYGCSLIPSKCMKARSFADKAFQSIRGSAAS